MSAQGSGDWLRARAGFATASRFDDIIKKGVRGQALKAREDYLIELVTERLTGEPIVTSIGVNGEYGKTLEAYARLAFEAETGIMCREVEFVPHPSVAWVGCSPDSLIGDDCGLEIKCPASSVIHLKTILDKRMPDNHIAQVQGNMWVTGRSSWWFVSYDARMPAHLRLFYQRIERNDTYINAMAAEVATFLKEVDEFTARIPSADAIKELRA